MTVEVCVGSGEASFVGSGSSWGGVRGGVGVSVPRLIWIFAGIAAFAPLIVIIVGWDRGKVVEGVIGGVVAHRGMLL